MPNSLSMNKRVFFVLSVTALLSAIVVFVLVPIVSKNIFFVLAIPFACLFVVVMVTRPKLALALLLSVRSLLDILLVHTKVEVSSGDTGIGGLLNLLILGLGAILVYRNLGEWRKAKQFTRFWMIFLAVCVISIGFSPHAISAVKILLQQIGALLIFLLPFFIVKDEKDKKFWIKVLLFSSVLPVAVANFGILTHFRLLYAYTEDSGLRLQGSFTHPNILAFYILLISTLSLYVLKTKSIILSPIQSKLLVLYMLNLMAILVITKTRSALMAWVLILFLYGILKEKKYLLIVLALSGVLMMTPQVQQRMSLVFGKSTSRAELGKNSLDWRQRFWASSMPLIRQRPVFGRGLGSFKILSPTFFSVVQGGSLAHNVYVQLLFETGVVGLIGYLGIFLSLMKIFYAKIKKKADRLSSESAIMFCFLVSHLAVCYSDNMLDYVAYNWYLYFFLGLATCSLYLPEKKETDTPID